MFLIGISILLLSNSGCRQPMWGSQSNGSLFDLSRVPRLFGGGSNQLASNGYGSNGLGFGGSGSQFANGSNQAITGSGINQQQFASLSGQVQSLNQRLSAYDSDNQLLNTEVASLKQKLQLANQYNQTLKTQLADTSGRVQQSELAKQAALQQLASAQMQIQQFNRTAQSQTQNPANPNWVNQSQTRNSQTQGQLAGFGGNSVPTTFAGGATIRANNSLMRSLSNIRIPGGQARMDGDVIRIEFPSDRMFVPGTYQIQAAQLPVMQNIVSTIRQSFPKQIVGIEAHWDNTPLNPPTTTHHQLTATQALAVFDNLVRLGLPKNQLFTMAMASNRPRHPQGVTGGVSPNRRIELVIYPETYDGSF